MRGRWVVRGCVAAVVTLSAVAAGSAQGAAGSPGAPPAPAALGRSPAHRAAQPAAGRPTASVAAATSPAAGAPAPSVPVSQLAELPSGGRTVLDRYRVVAFYGGPDGPALGVLGSGTPDQVAAQIEARARAFAGFGRPVLPAMELIATVAQGAPGEDGSYSAAIPNATIAKYLGAAHRHHMLLILDFQPGHAEFLPQVRAEAAFLRDPSVSVALDPEWKMGPGSVPGQVIGWASAAGIGAVAGYLSALVRVDHLPDKLLLVHQFRLAMLPDRAKIRPAAGIEVVFHADGFGTPQEKLSTWRALAFPGRPYGTGFKLFLTQDTRMMTPAQVMDLRPQPDVITYQ